jgi:hypothetical protein
MSKSQNRKRTQIVRTAFTPEEYAELIEKAAAAEMSAAGFLRASGLGRATPRTKRRPPVDGEKLERAIAEMRRIGNNLNQLAHASNMLLPPDAAQLRQSQQELLETLKLLREARVA